MTGPEGFDLFIGEVEPLLKFCPHLLHIWTAGAGLLSLRWWRSGKPKRLPAAANTDELIQAIARLDDEFERGEIAEAIYQRQRAELKARALSGLRSGDD